MKPKIFLNLLWNGVEKKFWRIKLKIVFSSKHKFFFNFYLLKKGKLEFLLTTFFLLEKKTELFSLQENVIHPSDLLYYRKEIYKKENLSVFPRCLNYFYRRCNSSYQNLFTVRTSLIHEKEIYKKRKSDFVFQISSLKKKI